MDPSEIWNLEKKQKRALHKAWVRSINNTTVLLYTDGSNSIDGTTASPWDGVLGPEWMFRFQGHCQIGSKSEIKYSEIHAIPEGLCSLVNSMTRNKAI